MEEIESRAMEKLRILEIQIHIKTTINYRADKEQRVAIARALINEPHIIMGDEPTGNLIKKTVKLYSAFFQELAERYHQTLLIVTHDNEFAARTHRIIEMEDGRIVKG